jgi:hypothetical protein
LSVVPVEESEGPARPPGPRVLAPTDVGPWPTIADLRAWCRLDPDPVEDDVLTEALSGAIAYVDGRTGSKWSPVDPDTGTPLPPKVPPGGWLATLYEGARLYRRRDSIDGTLGWADVGIVRVGRYDPDVEALLATTGDLVTPL